ncbi:hypothetical protein TNCV_2772151, partial [Trichonephila clavipes]
TVLPSSVQFLSHWRQTVGDRRPMVTLNAACVPYYLNSPPSGLKCTSKTSDFQSGSYSPTGVYDDLQGVHASGKIIWGFMWCRPQ